MRWVSLIFVGISALGCGNKDTAKPAQGSAAPIAASKATPGKAPELPAAGAEGGFDEADVAMLLPDQVKRKMAWWQKHKPEHTVIVAPLFLSEGYFTRKVIPERMAVYEYRYNGQALLPSPKIAQWMERQLAKVVRIRE